MKNKIFALISGLLIILIMPSLITACTGGKEKDNTAQTTENVAVTPQVTDGVDTPAAAPLQYIPPAGETPLLDIENPMWLMISGVANLLLLLVSTLFGKFWKKARDVLNSIHEGIADNNLSEQDIFKIVKAWKG